MANKPLAKIDTEVFSEKNILNNLFTKCKSCSLRRDCSMLTSEIASVKKKFVAKKKTLDKYTKSVNNDVDRYTNAKDTLKKYEKKLWTDFDNKLVETDCKFERDDIVEDLEMLQTKYNFSDARVFLIVKQHLRQSIIDFRAFKETARHKLISYRTTEDGSRIPIVNPLLNYKLQSGNFIVKLIEILDKITKEDKLLDNMGTSGSDFFKKYLSKLPDVSLIKD